MTTVIGVRFRHAGRIYYFNPGPFVIKKGDYVVVETVRGVEFGLCVTDPRLAGDNDIVAPLKTVQKKADEKDIARHNENLNLEKTAMAQCAEKAAEHGLEMKLIDCEYAFDGSKLIFYFTAEGRVDFRELVKDLAAIFRTRIELRQIGVRDEAKMTGGIGVCGRAFCCSTFLGDFIPVSIKMAKDQSLSLNPTKISGTCGRLMCCLKYEQDTYEELIQNMPSIGDIVETPDGTGEVLYVNTLRQLVKAGIKQEKGDVVINEYPLENITVVQRKGNKNEYNEEAERSLKELEKE